MEKNILKKECIYVYTRIYICINESIFVQQKLPEHCKSTILQYKKVINQEKKEKENSPPKRSMSYTHL